LLGLDAARGLALLGVFGVNMQIFSDAFGTFYQPLPESSDGLTVALFYLQGVFFTGKFYPLFSLLFGMGLVLMMASSARRGQAGAFTGIYLRRLAMLAVFGLIHGLAIWYGDVLLTYSICGLILFLCRSWPAKVMIPLGAGLMLFAAVLYGGLAALSAGAYQTPDASTPAGVLAAADEPGASKIARLIEAMGDGDVAGGPEDPVWVELERLAYREGPWYDVAAFRAISWVMMVFVTVLGVGWHVLGLFFLGAGLIKAGLLDESGRVWRRRLFWLGLLVGVPGSAAGAWLGASPDSALGLAGMAFLGMVFGPMLSLTYLCGMWRIAELASAGSRVALTVATPLQAAGRMALTNYLTQSVVSTFVFYHWGLGQFASWTRGQEWAMVVGVFAVQCVVSMLWLRVFAMGPMERLWRTITYAGDRRGPHA
jgi:uncharacterized protein